MAKSSPGLRKKGEYWHVDKTIGGIKIRESTGEKELELAERYLAKLVKEVREVKIYGKRKDCVFDEAAARYIEENSQKKSLDRDIISLKLLMPYIGVIKLRSIHSEILEGYIKDRQHAGISAGTLNRDLAVLRRVLSLSARLWRDESGNPWLDTVPLIPDVRGTKRKPRPISWSEQELLLKCLPGYLADMVLFALNTGMRDQEICNMKWTDEREVSGSDITVFIVPEGTAKNGHERTVPLNAYAKKLVQARRGNGSDYVFDYKGRKLGRINNKAWQRARDEVSLTGVRVHDLRHTFGMRLRAADVSYENRQDLLGHHAGRITTHYCRADILKLHESVELLCGDRNPELTLIRIN